MIPKIFHFIYLFGSNTKQFNINHYISIKSNIIVNKPEAVRIYTNNIHSLRSSNWYQRLYDEFGITEVFVDEDMCRCPNGVLSPYPTHQADVLRLNVMKSIGGIYSDVDSIAINPLPEEWFSTDGAYFCYENFEEVPESICNGFFLSSPNHQFINDCLEVYSEYDPELCKPGTTDWTLYSVQAMWELLKNNPNRYSNLNLLQPSDFQPVYLSYPEVEKLFFLRDLDLEDYINKSYQLHLWEGRHQGILKILSEDYFVQSNSIYARLCKKYIL